jgi:7-alpha-hydroxysteroid dehydrogenase
VRVNGVFVGSIATSALGVVMANDEVRTKMEQATPLRRIGDPDDIASAVLFLSSPAGSYITGKMLEVDGGLQYPNFEIPLEDL